MATFARPNDSFTLASREAWLPRLRTGYFYVNDRQYYLYSGKKTRTLEEATVLVFFLADAPVPGSVTVRIEGIEFSNYRIEGNELHLLLDDQESFSSLWAQLELDLNQWDFIAQGFMFGPSNEVQVTYTSLQWEDTASFGDPTGNVYNSLEVTEVYLIKNADRIDYVLSRRDDTILPTALGDTLAAPTGWIGDPPKDRAPVVITDDSLEYHNPIDYQTEFHVDPITGEVFFNANRNFLQNPTFEVGSAGVQFDDPTYRYPLEWRVTETTTTPEIQGTAYHGDRCYRIDSTGVMTQLVQIDPLTHYTTSTYVSGGTGELCITFLDDTLTYIDITGGISITGVPNDELCHYSSTATSASGSVWSRTSMTFGQEVDSCDAPDTFYPIPTAATYLEFKLRRVSGTPCFDGAMVEEDIKVTQFIPLPGPDITIEYETSEDGFYVPNNTELLLPQVNDPDCNALSTPSPGGYLFLEEFSNVDDFQFGKGSIGPEPSVAPTAVVDVTGVVDLDMGRAFVPYAKTSGWTKYRQRATFHLENPAPVQDVTDLGINNGNPLPVPNSIEWVIGEGLQELNEAAELVVVPDCRQTVRVDAFVFDRWENPAFMFTGAATVPNGTVYPDNPTTSHAGHLTIEYTPPNVAGTGDLGVIDCITLIVGEVIQTLPIRGYRQAGLDFDAFIQG